MQMHGKTAAVNTTLRLSEVEWLKRIAENSDISIAGAAALVIRYMKQAHPELSEMRMVVVYKENVNAESKA